MLKELFKYFSHYIKPRAGTCEVTIVRRDISPTGRIGEVYVDGKYVAMSCDALMYDDEVIKYPLAINFDLHQRILCTELYTVSRGDFTAKVQTNFILIGSQDPTDNDLMLATLIDKVSGFRYIRLTVLNRYLEPLRRFKQ
jgi:hypothetical protein